MLPSLARLRPHIILCRPAGQSAPFSSLDPGPARRSESASVKAQPKQPRSPADSSCQVSGSFVTGTWPSESVRRPAGPTRTMTAAASRRWACSAESVRRPACRGGRGHGDRRSYHWARAQFRRSPSLVTEAAAGGDSDSLAGFTRSPVTVVTLSLGASDSDSEFAGGSWRQAESGCQPEWAAARRPPLRRDAGRRLSGPGQP